jgi:hypothetical protein
MTTTNIGACGCCVQPPQCCCDESGPHEINAGDECTGSQFNRPNAVPNITLVFEWCGLTAERTLLQSGTDSFFADQNVDFKVCDTNGRYGEGDVSYTQANRKALSVYIFPGGSGGLCGYKQNFMVSGAFEGTGFRLLGDGNFYAVETVIAGEVYSCKLYQCYDGSEADVSMTTSPTEYGFTTDDTCGAAGAFDPCKFTAPELTVVGAP